MDGRRSFLKAALVAMGAALVAPVRMLFGATPPKTSAARGRLSLSEDKIVRSYYEDGWNKGNNFVINALSLQGKESARLLERYRTAFPDLRFAIGSVEKVGEEVHVEWTAQGTNRGALDGRAATGRKASIQGLTKFRIADGKIVSAAPEWDQAGLQRQLGARAPG